MSRVKSNATSNLVNLELSYGTMTCNGDTGKNVLYDAGCSGGVAEALSYAVTEFRGPERGCFENFWKTEYF